MEFSCPGSSLDRASPCREGIMLPEVLAGGASFVIGQSLNWATRSLEAKLLTSPTFANRVAQIQKAVERVKGKTPGVLPAEDPAKMVAHAASNVSSYAVSTMGGVSTCGVIALACVVNGNNDLSETVKKMAIRLEELTRQKKEADAKVDTMWKSLRKEFQESQAASMEQGHALSALTGRVTILEEKGGGGGKD